MGFVMHKVPRGEFSSRTSVFLTNSHSTTCSPYITASATLWSPANNQLKMALLPNNDSHDDVNVNDEDDNVDGDGDDNDDDTSERMILSACSGT
jgi:hypothetical protein